LADIIEELGKVSKHCIFGSLTKKKQPMCLRNLNLHEQVHIIEEPPIGKSLLMYLKKMAC